MKYRIGSSVAQATHLHYVSWNRDNSFSADKQDRPWPNLHGRINNFQVATKPGIGPDIGTLNKGLSGA